MKNRIASLFLAFALLMSLCNFAVARDNLITVKSGGAERFTDVPADHWAYAYIDKVVGSGLFNGRTETTFEPSNAMTRSQFVMVMARMEGLSSLEGQYTETKFPDVAPTRRAAGPIAWASEDAQNFVRGFSDGTFKPDSPITRGQFAALIHRYIIAKRYTNLHVVDPEPAQFTDADSVSNAFKEDVDYARVHGLLTGYSDGTVRASNPITRAAIAAILARFLDLVSESGYTPLLDGPIGGGDNGDSGDSNNPPVEVPTSYGKIKMSVTNSKRGETKISSVLRNGVQVASDDVQPGDVVTFTHEPEDGYTVKITIKDSKGKDVPFTTKGNTTTFTAPDNLPVNITVKYQKESTSSGGGGGGGGGGSGSGSSGGETKTDTYQLKVAANAKTLTGAALDNVDVYLTQTLPQFNNPLPDKTAGTEAQTFTSNTAKVTVYAVFLPKEDKTTFQFASTANKPAADLTDADKMESATVQMRLSSQTSERKPVSYVTLTRDGKTSNPDTITVTGYFDVGGPNIPIETTKDVTWTVAYQPADGNANYRFYAEKPTIPAQALNTSGQSSQSVPPVKIDTASGELVDKNNPPKVYFMISPKSGFDYDADLQAFLENGDADGSVEVGKPETNADGSVRLYEITKKTFETKTDETTNLKMTMAPANSRNLTHAVNVESYLGTTRIDNDPANTKAVATSDPANNATAGNDVTIKVPESPVFGGYQFVKVEPEGVQLPDRDNNGNYTFTMPDNDVTVKVYYEEIPDNSLTYQVNVTLNGSGTLPLNIAGQLQTVDKTTSYVVKLDGDAAKVFEESAAAGKPDLKQSDYARLFDGRKDEKLPVYFDGVAVASKGFKLASDPTSAPAVPVNPENTEDRYVLEAGKDINITVNFDEIESYGYTLTIVGQGVVSGKFNGKDFSYDTRTSSAPQTVSTGLVVCDEKPGFSIAEPTVKSGYVAEQPQITVTDKNGVPTTTVGKYDENIDLESGILANVVVEIHKADRVALPFTVTATGNGNVKVKPESGKILLDDKANDADDAKDKLTGADAKADDTLVSTEAKKETSGHYYAYEDTIITLVPDGEVLSVTFTDGEGNEKEVHDVLNTAGFSFQLKEETNAAVQFGKVDSYEVRLQAPYSESDAGLRSESTKIPANATIGSVLYSLNDGGDMDPTTRANGIENKFFTTPGTLNQFLHYYLTHKVVAKEDSDDKQTGEEALESMLEETVASNIKTILPDMIDKEKANLKKNANVDGSLATELTTAQTETGDLMQPLSGPAKSSLLNELLKLEIRYRFDETTKKLATVTEGNEQKLIVDMANGKTFQELFDEGALKESDFVIWTKATPIITTDKETELKTTYPSVAAKIDGQSVQKQLSSIVENYTNNITVVTNYEKLTPDVDATVAPDLTSGPKPVTIDVSAKVTVEDTADWPHLPEDMVKMASYADTLNVFVVANIETITVQNGLMDLSAIETQFPGQFQTTDVYSSSQFSFASNPVNTLREKLRSVDDSVAQKWKDAFEGTADKPGLLNPENDKEMPINMGQVLKAELLRQVVNDAIQNPKDKLVTKVEALGEGATTRTAFQKLADDFIKPVGEGADLKLLLQNKKSGTTEIGWVDGNKLVLGIDFNDILRDKFDDQDQYPSDNVPYEKLVDLLMNLRDGVSEDIRLTSEANPNRENQTSEAVIASMIEKQIRNGKGTLTAKKWGMTLTSSSNRSKNNMTDSERKEISAMVAKLIMDSDINDPTLTMENVWKNFTFKANGYQSIELTFTLDGARRTGLSGIVEALNFALKHPGEQDVEIGFKLEQKMS